ncbi:Mov34/MPN/PAD-1 family protein [Stieleria sp. JC731]|uniref:Mov34/MPN/PAD-1 family protein n=1 Tax=Pirellulaceae TaxID=2691357 RepID=UPI001E2D96A1|nr:Mov34/MPN/PAD-1 family protein [Stieleria sp. JC731]MCC9601036.1 Mov34/MPN/PAD-1 family protein [Stieleria sp. JC731]
MNKNQPKFPISKPSNRVLRFTPYAMAKLLFLRDVGPTEVGGFGISNAEDLLLVEDFQLVEQVCTAVSVDFDDDSVADFFDSQVDAGRKPEQFARIWIHTHPGSSPSPSGTDEATFERCFGGSDWCVMYILAREGNSYARARFNVGPRCDRRLRCRTQFECEFPASDHEAWFSEYCENVSVDDPFASRDRNTAADMEFEWWQESDSMQVQRSGTYPEWRQ